MRHELLGDEAGEAGFDAAVLVDLRELVQLGAAVLLAAPRLRRARSASSASRCELTEMYSPAAIDIAPATSPAMPAVDDRRARRCRRRRRRSRGRRSTRCRRWRRARRPGASRPGGSCGARHTCADDRHVDATLTAASLRARAPRIDPEADHARSRHRRHRPHADRPREQGLARRLPSRRPLGARSSTRCSTRCPQLDPAQVEDVIWGCGQPAGEAGFNVGRVAGDPRRRRRARA